MALSRIGLAEIEEGSKTGSISFGIKSRTLKGVTKESIPAEEEGATTSSQEGKKSEHYEKQMQKEKIAHGKQHL